MKAVLDIGLSAATMAVAFALYERLLGERFAFALPTPVLVVRLTLLVALPVLAGIGVRRWKPAWVTAHRSTLRNLCLAGIACLLVYGLVNRWTQVAGGGGRRRWPAWPSWQQPWWWGWRWRDCCGLARVTASPWASCSRCAM